MRAWLLIPRTRSPRAPGTPTKFLPYGNEPPDTALQHRVVGFAGTADRAVELADELRPDLVLMDIRLRGERDGIDAAIETRERFDIPSLIISAHSDAWARERATPAQVLGFIPKPFDRALLEAGLNGALKP